MVTFIFKRTIKCPLCVLPVDHEIEVTIEAICPHGFEQVVAVEVLYQEIHLNRFLPKAQLDDLLAEAAKELPQAAEDYRDYMDEMRYAKEDA